MRLYRQYDGYILESDRWIFHGESVVDVLTQAVDWYEGNPGEIQRGFYKFDGGWVIVDRFDAKDYLYTAGVEL